MFKVISAELKKIVSKPGIFILSVLLALILVSGVFIYKPTPYQNTVVELNGLTVLDKYSNFTGNTLPNVENEITKAVEAVNNYKVKVDGEMVSYYSYVKDLYFKFNDYLDNYFSAQADTTQDPAKLEQYINNLRKNSLIPCLKSLHTAIDTGINGAKNGSYAILTTEDNYKLYTKTYEEVLKLVSANSKLEDEYNHKYKKDFEHSINSFIFPTLSANVFQTFVSDNENSKLTTVKNRLALIKNEIDDLKEKAEDGDENKNINNCNKIDALANEYVMVAETFTNMVKYSLISNAFNAVSVNKQLNIMFLKNESEYNSDSLAIRYTYLFDHNKTENSYAHPLTIGTTSNQESNAYDYAYFVLRLFSFVIIVYAVMAACQTIAGEIKDGSMRYFAIRPISRKDIYFGKMLAIFIMSTIMLIFSTIIAFCVGWGCYGIKSLDILTIFNSGNAIVIKPFVMLGIYIFSFMFELLVYLSIAMLLACLIKSDLLAVTLMLVIYLINTLLPMFVSGPNSWLAFYPFSHINFYSLFGSSIYAIPSDFFNQILGIKVYAGTNLGLTISVVSLVIIIINLIAVKWFQTKEL